MTELEAARAEATELAARSGKWVAVHETGCEADGDRAYIVRAHDLPLDPTEILDQRVVAWVDDRSNRKATMTDKATIAARTLIAVLTDASLFASAADKERVILRSIEFTVNGERGQVVTTDSYALGHFTFAASGTLGALIDVDDVKRIITLAKQALTTAGKYGAPTELTLELDGDVMTVCASDASITMRVVGFDFPNWHQLVPPADAPTGTFATFDAAKVERMGKVALGTKRGDKLTMAVRFSDNLKVHQFYASTDDVTFRGLLMPYRSSDTVEVFGPFEVVKPVASES